MTDLTERLRLQFRAEAFNVFNTYDFYGASFNNNPSSAGFGTITKAAVSSDSTAWPRQVQFGVKLIF